MYTVDPIGYLHTASTALYEVPRQASLSINHDGIIHLKKGCQFEQALEGLEGFDRIWLLFHFHQHQHWKPKVLPPRGGKKQGVFATRSPHRPNFIGLSCVKLKAIKGLKLFIEGHDLIDQTPILDIKPYLNYADSFHCQHQGWLDELSPLPPIVFEWSVLAQTQLEYLHSNWNYQLKQAIEHRLSQSPLPYANNRVKQIDSDFYQLAYQTWRVIYHYHEGLIKIKYLKSGYDAETLMGKKMSKWNDVHIHQAFIVQFKDWLSD